MILESKKLFFKTVFIVFEDDKVAEMIESVRYSSIVAISRKDFPGLSKYKRIKTTSVIDLTLSSEDIFRKFNDTTRNEIRRTENMLELEIVLEDSKTDLVYDLYK